MTQNKRAYVDLHTVFPNEIIEGDVYKIEKFELSESHVRLEQIRGERWLTSGLKANFPYVKLVKKGEGVMMSDTPMERNTNDFFIQQANGDVLIFGLGLGLIILPLLNDENVKSITVVELYQDLIDLVQPILRKKDLLNKLTIIQGDCFEFHKQVPKNKKWDCIYGDIWIGICVDNYEEMKILTRNFKNKLNKDNPNSFIQHWLKDHLKREISQEKRSSNSWW
jgi:hypothetical protein